MRGDILFYSKDPRDMADQLIAWWTRGDAVHVGADLGDGTMIDARFKLGVSHHAIGSTRCVPFNLAAHTSSERIEAGIAFLFEQLGASYSELNIVDQVIPRWMSVTLHQRHAYDCSNLIARYLDIAGGVDLSPLDDSPDVITPNDLARCAGLLDAEGHLHSTPVTLPLAAVGALIRSLKGTPLHG